MSSYEEHSAGIDHSLVAVFKGFPDGKIPSDYRERLGPHGAQILALDDTGFDIGSYWAAARVLSYESFCFLNSFSVIRDGDWLTKLVKHHGPSVGVVGASGSWQSHFTPSWQLVPKGLRVLGLSPKVEQDAPVPSPSEAPQTRFGLLKRYLQVGLWFPTFPNPHIRTNAFLMRRDLVMDVKVLPIANKDDALRFESGRNGLTRQVVSRGLEILVAGRDGMAYPPERWPESHTFRSGKQANLLVSDNRTEEWAELPSAQQEELSAKAWGVGHTGAAGMSGARASR